MKNLFSGLFWRLSFFFLISLMCFAVMYIYITRDASIEYSQETSQRLNRKLADRVAHETEPFKDGVPNEEELEHFFHNVMIINPSVEVYLLDTEGEILSYFAPFGEVKLEKVGLDPIHTFIEDTSAFIKGEDPRNPGVFKVFSASQVYSDDVHMGYMYVILASQELATVSESLASGFGWSLALKSILVTLVLTFLVGLLIIWLLTKNLNKIMATVSEFREGKLEARIKTKTRGEFSDLASNFNSMADTIVENIDELKSVDKLRKELIANVSHDLRTPLTAIHGYAETLLLMEGQLDEKQKKEYTEVILSSTKRVIKLVDDLFEISKLESDQIQTNRETFSISQMLSDIIMKYELLAKSKSISLTIENVEKDVFIYADIALIDRVFQNLLDNALKHTPHGESISVVIDENESNGMVSIKIQDTGVGIPKDELPFIFDRFKKIKGNTKEGSGLGLAIVKKILELHEVEINVQSELDKGTAFYFDLPMAK